MRPWRMLSQTLRTRRAHGLNRLKLCLRHLSPFKHARARRQTRWYVCLSADTRTERWHGGGPFTNFLLFVTFFPVSEQQLRNDTWTMLRLNVGKLHNSIRNMLGH